MSIKISRAVVEQAYDLLCETTPFLKWNLPPAEAIYFIITRSTKFRGEYEFRFGQHYISVSGKCHETLDSLLQTIAHEMCHMIEKITGVRDDVQHGKSFQLLADQVCKAHVWDRGMF